MMIRPMAATAAALSALLTLSAPAPAQPASAFVAQPLTDSRFTDGIEGPAVDANGDLFVVNLDRQQTIGRVRPDGTADVFVTLAGTSVGNGIRFDRAGAMFVADYVGHNVLRVDPQTRQITVFAHDDRMSQPNDLAIGPDDMLWASDPDWKAGTGRIWRIDRQGRVHLAADAMGTTNGIEVSPDGRTLYVNESQQRRVWAFAIGADHTLSQKRLVLTVPDYGFDGMRADVDGNLWIARYDKGTALHVSPTGQVFREVAVLGAKPSNISFGGPDGRTAYVTEVEHRRVVTFRVERPGVEWTRQRAVRPASKP